MQVSKHQLTAFLAAHFTIHIHVTRVPLAFTTFCPDFAKLVIISAAWIKKPTQLRRNIVGIGMNTIPAGKDKTRNRRHKQYTFRLNWRRDEKITDGLKKAMSDRRKDGENEENRIERVVNER